MWEVGGLGVVVVVVVACMRVMHGDAWCEGSVWRCWLAEIRTWCGV